MMWKQGLSRKSEERSTYLKIIIYRGFLFIFTSKIVYEPLQFHDFNLKVFNNQYDLSAKIIADLFRAARFYV